jgi:putative nucleotidyltransferase with HDIG domain
MLVHFVTDEATKIPAIRAMLEPQYLVVCQLLESGATQINPGSILMIDADLRQMICVDQIRVVLQQDLRGIPEKLFVVKNNVRSMIAQALALGATSIVSGPKEIIFKLAQIEAKVSKGGVANASCEIANSAAAFASMFSAIRRGQSIDIVDAEHATTQIMNSIDRNGLSSWLDDVRRYHQGTFQHCLLVTGVAVAFALEIGFTKPDVKRLGMAATLHDIGKARIPLSILDKPGQLDPGEQEIMRSHPAIGYELLKGLPGVTPEILDGVKHHHEYLDGSGYPDGLTAAQISDLVRLLTIADIFAALIESRPYRPQMSRQDAYKILCGMDGKLERALLKAFGNVALVA